MRPPAEISLFRRRSAAYLLTLATNFEVLIGYLGEDVPHARHFQAELPAGVLNHLFGRLAFDANPGKSDTYFKRFATLDLVLMIDQWSTLR